MKIYLAHNFAARDWLREEIKPKLEAMGHEVTSRWIWDDMHLVSGNAVMSQKHDLEDIARADVLVLFTEQHHKAERQGKGKFIELGYALGIGKMCVLCGADLDSSVFYYNPTLLRSMNVDELFLVLGALK